MATGQVVVEQLDAAQLLKTLNAVKKGDFSARMPFDQTGLPGKIADTLNDIIELNERLTKELERISKVVGKEGKISQRANLGNAQGAWADSVEAVNTLITDLVQPTIETSRVIRAVANGDLTQTIPQEIEGRPLKGEFLQTARVVNTMVEQLASFAVEVTRVAREVGTEGKLGGQAVVKGVAGTWKDLTDNVNNMSRSLTVQVRNIAEVATAIASGDLSKKITADVKGEIYELKNTMNTMVDQLNSFASEVTRVAREVGVEGKLGVQAEVKGVAGTWKDLTDSVNQMASSLTGQVRNIAAVTTAIANGDLSKKITVDVKGEIYELKNTINTMVDQLNSFASEVTRVAREVGTEGKLGVQAEVKGVAGTWKDLTDSVNQMAGNLTGQVRNIAEVATAIANGDLSKKITVDVKGEILELKNTMNTMVDQLGSFASEVTRVAREVGAEGKLGGQAFVKGVGGTWKDLTDSVNFMAGSLTAQVRNIAAVTTAVANGDLSKKITVDVKGEILELKNTFNTMVDQLNSFASEVTRVAREVGTEGKLGVQAEVKGVAGTWKDLTDSVNQMAGNLTGQVRNIAEVATAIANGDLSKKITVDVKGEILELKNTFNTMVDQLNSFASEVTRVAREVGTEGKLGGQAYVKGVAGTWKDLTDNVNLMAGNLTGQVRNIAEVSKAIANGDLSKKITVDVKGEILDLKDTINTMVDQLNSFASEVTRVAREVGTEGKLGGQAEVKGVAGTWKDLTDSVNQMAGNLTAQVRGIARVVTSVANGDLKRKLALEAKGEIATLADTINEMIDTLATFADQVTTVAREVGIEGKLGGQAKVPGAAGTWRALTDNVNELAATLTTQLRAIAEVATAVTKGDLTRSISVAAQGEVAVLKDNINQMIANLRETTQKNTEQDWLKTNLAKFTRMLQGQRDLETVSKLILSELAPLVSAQHGVFYLMDSESNQVALKLLSTYAYRERKSLANVFHLGEGIVGQCALEKERILLTDVPENYIKISSGLGESSPLNVVVLPVLFEGQVSAVIELASFQRFSEIHLTFLDQLTESIAIVLNNIAASMKTERLLSQSQSLAQELQCQQKELTAQQKELTDTNKRLELQANSLQTSEELLKKQQEELRQTNEELEEKARILSLKNQEVEQKNREIEFAKVALEEKADQLALSSKYKSEFLANMSHELRTPLNSLLLLAKLLADNPESNLTPRQVEFAKTIYSAGSDLLALINDILDLAKIESGTMVADIDNMLVTDLRDNMERTFQQIAFDKGLSFNLEFEGVLPRTIQTDAKRLEQVIKNLLSNAFKFTLKGIVNLYVTYAKNGWDSDNESLNRAEHVIAFSVIDTGIGIPLDKQKLIFEAFQQADGTTSRKYGGTGLGLSISRELARLLGGEIRLVSAPGKGSTFTFYLPQPFSGDVQKRAYRTSQPQVTSPSQFAFGIHSSTSHLPSSHPFSRVENLLGNIHLPNFAQPPRASVETEVIDDRESVQPGDAHTLLIIEDDLSFAKILLDFARTVGFKGVLTTKGDSGLALAKSLRPAAIVLDLRLPTVDGWKILDRLKHNPATRHIPVQVISIEDWRQCLDFGAFGFLKKPVTNDMLEKMFLSLKSISEKAENCLAILDSDDVRRKSIAEMVGHGDINSIQATDLESLKELIDTHKISCLVIGPTVDGMSFLDVLHKIKEQLVGKNISVVVWWERELLNEQVVELKRIGESFPIKLARNLEQILDETTLLLHRVESDLPESKRRILEQLHRSEPKLAGRRVLIVDDDVRNIFALTSLLERHNMDVLHVEDGQTAVELLSERNDTDIVLMDIMMPGMDGYETMKVIRAMPQYRRLPIIALTAQAMKGDREKCLSAGASDYVTKPVDAEELLSLLRLWLSADHNLRNMTAQSWETALGSLRLKQ